MAGSTLLVVRPLPAAAPDASSGSSTGASTGPATTPTGPSPPAPPGSATRSTRAPAGRDPRPRSRARSSPLRSRSGCGNDVASFAAGRRASRGRAHRRDMDRLGSSNAPGAPRGPRGPARRTDRSCDRGACSGSPSSPRSRRGPSSSRACHTTSSAGCCWSAACPSRSHRARRRSPTTASSTLARCRALCGSPSSGALRVGRSSGFPVASCPCSSRRAVCPLGAGEPYSRSPSCPR